MTTPDPGWQDRSFGMIALAGVPSPVHRTSNLTPSNLIKPVDRPASNAVSHDRWSDPDASRVVVAIPAYNEGRAIQSVVERARVHADETIVIDDGSFDGTSSQANAAGATVVAHKTNRGYGAAVMTAFEEAYRRNADYLVILDGDAQHDPDDIPKLLGAHQATGSEVVIGSRYAPSSQTSLPLYRRIGLSVVNALTRLALNVNSTWDVADTQSGFRSYTKEVIQSMVEDGTLSTNMSASTDILYHVRTHGYQVAEVGTTVEYNLDHTSSQNPFVHGIILVVNLLEIIRTNNPKLFYGGVAVVFCSLALSLLLLFDRLR